MKSTFLKKEILKKLWIKDEDAMSIEWDSVCMTIEEMIEELLEKIEKANGKEEFLPLP